VGPMDTLCTAILGREREEVRLHLAVLQTGEDFERSCYVQDVWDWVRWTWWRNDEASNRRSRWPSSPARNHRHSLHCKFSPGEKITTSTRNTPVASFSQETGEAYESGFVQMDIIGWRCEGRGSTGIRQLATPSATQLHCKFRAGEKITSNT